VDYLREVELPIIYKNVRLDSAYRIDLIVGNRVIVELKSVQEILPVHEAQLLTYMRLTRMPVGLLINFNVPVLKDGIRRRVL
jgi:GxxExxY protein